MKLGSSKKKKTCIGCIGFIILLLIIISLIPTTEQNQTNTEGENTLVETENTSEKEREGFSYEIIKTENNIRFDGGETLYILIQSVNLKDDTFKEDIKDIVKEIANSKGGRFSVEIYDDSESLEQSYKNRTVEEYQRIHFIASFDGELSTNIYLNTLSFFPSAFSDNEEIGKYAETLEFNPIAQ